MAVTLPVLTRSDTAHGTMAGWSAKPPAQQVRAMRRLRPAPDRRTAAAGRAVIITARTSEALIPFDANRPPMRVRARTASTQVSDGSAPTTPIAPRAFGAMDCTVAPPYLDRFVRE